MNAGEKQVYNREPNLQTARVPVNAESKNRRKKCSGRKQFS